MALRLGDEAPDFTAETTEGTINFYDYLGDGWGVLFSHPKDFTPVCTTELGAVAKLKPEFDKRNVKVIGLSVDALDNHKGWAADIEETQGAKLNFPVIADSDRKVSDLYDMIHPNANDTLTVRSVFIIGADKKVKLIITYPASTGRNFDEILRVDRLAPAHRELQRRDTGELEGRRGRDHRARRLRRGRQGEVPQGLEGAQALPPGHPPAQQVSPSTRTGVRHVQPHAAASRRSVADVLPGGVAEVEAVAGAGVVEPAAVVVRDVFAVHAHRAVALDEVEARRVVDRVAAASRRASPRRPSRGRAARAA